MFPVWKTHNILVLFQWNLKMLILCLSFEIRPLKGYSRCSVPKKQTVNISLPIGQYTIQYAQNNYIKDAPWQGLNKFRGSRHYLLESNLEHNVTLVQYPNNSGYFIRGTGIV